MSAHNALVERNAKIIAERAAGKTYAEIARTYGISNSRVQQIERRFEIENELEKQYGARVPIRYHFAIKNSGLTEREFLALSDEEIARIPNVGRKSIAFAQQRRVVLGL